MEVDQGSFTPSVFAVAGGMRDEVRDFYSRLSLKKGIDKSKMRSWIQSKENFAILRSMLLCLRDLRLKLVNEKLNTELDHTSMKKKLIKIVV